MPFIFRRCAMRVSIGIVLVCAVVAGAFSQDLRIRVSPEFLYSFNDSVQGGIGAFGHGAGATLGVDTDAFRFVTPYGGVSARFISPPTSALDASLFLASGGTGVRFFAFPIPRLKVSGSIGGGAYVGSYSSGSESVLTGNMFWEIGGQAGFRVTPSLTIIGGVSYLDLRTETDTFYNGLSFSVGADIGLGMGSVLGRATIEEAESTPVLPILSADYARQAFGSLTIKNAETAEMRDIEVWFEVDGYTSGPLLCGSVAYLPKRGVATVPLVAGFSDAVMDVTEDLRVSGQVRIVYDLLGEERVSTAETTVTILHRNSLQWTEERMLAAFVSPNDPAVLELSKYMAGIVRANALSEIDPNLQYALGLFEGFRLLGLSWGPDPQTPFVQTHASPDAIDYVQYPYQTLAYRGGDSDDLAVVYAAALESIGVPSALIVTSDEVLVAFQMSRNAEATRGMFLNADDFLFIDDHAWVPVRMSMLREGFLQAWNGGAGVAAADAAFGDRLFTVADAWASYPPPGVPDVSADTEKPGEAQLVNAFSNVVNLVVLREVTPRVAALRESFGEDGGNGRQRNFLGITYARYGMYQEALTEFQAALELGYGRATVNTGNVAYLLGDYEAAVQWYTTAVERSPDDSLALIGLARALYELDRFDEADEYFQMATDVQPSLGDRYSYLSARLTGSEARASAATERSGDMLWNE